jgi:hypothetical protein
MLLRRVEHFLKRTRTAPTRFGRDVLNDSRFVFDLRMGRRVTEATRMRVNAWLDARRTMTDAANGLARALCAGLAGATPIVEAVESRTWASITFSGERHRIALRIEGGDGPAAADRFLDGLAEREFDLGGHLLADIAAVADERDGDVIRLTLEALTVEKD